MDGSLVNRLTEGPSPVEPEVGMGATLLMFSDRNAYTITAVERFKSGKRAGQVSAVLATPDIATRSDDRGMSDHQNYTFETDPTAEPRRFRLSKDGTFRPDGDPKGNILKVGYRSHYFDFSF